MHGIPLGLSELISPMDILSPPASPSTPPDAYKEEPELGQRVLRGGANAPSPRKHLTRIPLEEDVSNLSDVIISYYSIISCIEQALECEQPDQSLELSLWSSIVLAARSCAQKSLEPSIRYFFNLKLVHATEQCLEFHRDGETRKRLCNQIIETAESCLESNFNTPNTLVFLHGYLASAYKNLGNYEKASKSAEEGLRVPEANSNLYMQLYIEYAGALINLKQHEEAKSLIDHALNQNPSDEERNLLSLIREPLDSCQDQGREPPTKRERLESYS